MNYLFSDLVDIPSFKQMMDSFYELTGLNSALLDVESRIITRTVWQDICANFHRANPQTEYRCIQSDSYTRTHLQNGPYVAYQCWNGLMEYAVPIIVEGHHIATFILGQLFHEPPDIEKFTRQAREFGFDETTYLEAVRKVPIVSRERVKAAMNYFTQLAEYLAANGIARRNLLETTEKLRESEELFKVIANYNYDWEEWIGVDGRLRWVSPSVERITGYSVDECMAMEKYPFSIIYEEDRIRVAKFRSKATRGGVGNDEEFRIRRKDGVVSWVSASWQPINDMRGNPVGYRATIRDIARRKQGEESLRQSRNELEYHVQKRTAELEEANQALSNEIIKRKRKEEALRQLLVQLTHSQELTTTFLNAAQTASSSLEIEQVLLQIAHMLAEAINMPYCGIYLRDADQDIFVRMVGSGHFSPEQAALVDHLRLDPGQFTLAREAIEKKATIICQDARSDPRFDWKLLNDLDPKSVLVVPIKAGDKILGLALVYTIEDRHPLSQEDVALADGIASAVALAIENARLYGETRKQLAEITGLQRVNKGLLQKISFQEVLDIVCVEAQRLVGATGSVILLLDKSGCLRVTHRSGTPEPTFEILPVDNSLAGLAVQANEPVMENDPLKLKAYPWRPPLTALLAVPLQADGKVIGALHVMNKSGGFNKEDRRIINLFADQAAINIEKARLHQKAEELAVLQERQRLARELHDSVAQALYTITLYADAISILQSSENKDAMVDYLGKLRDIAQEGLRDMRLLIFELRPHDLEKGGLATALRSRLESVEARAGLQTNLHVDGEERLPLVVEEELYRIAQEALNNAIKHSHAKHVDVYLMFNHGKVRMEIRDDGEGFDLDLAKLQGGVGLSGMKERSQRIGAKMIIGSRPGKGTWITVDAEISGELDIMDLPYPGQ